MKPGLLLLALFPLFISVAQADTPDAAAKPVDPAEGAISSTQRLADRCTDFTSNGWSFKAPRNFLKWLDAFTDPGIYFEFANRSLDPQSYVRTLSSLIDPGTPKNYLEWSNPEIYEQWAQAASDEQFYGAVTNILFDTSRIMRWVMLPIDGRAWGVLGNAANPDTWLKWLKAPVDPKTQELLAKAANPETARVWFEALGDPANTPWLNAPFSDMPAAEPAPETPAAPPAEQTSLPGRDKAAGAEVRL